MEEKIQKMKFLENFDPEKSNREKRKLKRKIYEQPTKSSTYKKPSIAYNEKGIHIATGLDLCDCLNDKCAGCFYPCPKCQSNKCGHDCRQNRKWMYDMVEIQGTDTVYRNHYT